MTRPSFLVSGLVAGVVLILSGCAMETGDFPSLAKRPIERKTEALVPPEPEPTVAVADPLSVEQRQRLEAAVELNKAASVAFAAALPGTQSAIASAGPTGGENWAVAERALTRLAASRAGSVTALADLDRLQLERSEQEQAGGAWGGADVIDAARLPVAEAVASQRETLDRLSARLGE